MQSSGGGTRDIYMMNAISHKYLGLLTRQFTVAHHRGWLCLCAIKYPDTVEEKWFRPRDRLVPLLQWAAGRNRQGYNIYVSWAVYGVKSRRLSDCLGSAAFVADWDKPGSRRGGGATLSVATSRGRWQDVYVHDIMEVNAAGAAYKERRTSWGCTPESGDPVHLWRVPGTTNWPNAKKKEAGRGVEPSTWDGVVNGRATLLAPRGAVATGGGDAGGYWPHSRTGRTPPPRWLREKWDDGSAYFHSLVARLAKLGWGVEEIARQVRGVAPARYAGRLEREVDRSLEKSGLERPEDAGALRFVTAAGAVEEEVSWLWYPYLPRGEVTLVDGDGGVGKTSFILRICADLLDGGKMVNGERVRGGVRVGYISTESSLGKVTLPLLTRMGVRRLENFYHLEDTGFDLSEESLVRLRMAIREHKLDVVVADPLAAFLPLEVEMNNYQHTLWIGSKIREVAAGEQVAFIGVRHNTKGSKDKLAYKGMGSAGWIGVCRSQFSLKEDADEEGQFVASLVKHQFASRDKCRAIVYEFEDVRGRGIVSWVGLSSKSSEEINDEKVDVSDRKTKREDAKKWLAEFLAGGPREAWKIFEEAEGRSLGARTIERAAEDLRVVKTQEKRSGGARGSTSFWSLAT